MVKSEKSKLLILTMIVLSIITFVLCGYFSYRYYILVNPHYVKIEEKGRVDYKVCLKENKFYESKCVEKNNQYVASLIKDIPVNLKYDLSFLGGDVDFKYKYKVYAILEVVDRDNSKKLFTKKELIEESDFISAVNNASINYDLNIDYNKYNDLLNSFVTIYDLDETVNNLKINLSVDVSDNGSKKIKNMSKDSVVSLNIPLTKKVVNIDFSTISNVENTDASIMKSGNSTLNLLAACLCFSVCLMLVVSIIYYYQTTRTAYEIYKRRIKKITSTYDSYIQRITGNYPIGASQICKIISFNDMLEIKDSSDKPLLMLENETKTGTFFIIPVGEGVIYTYALRVEDIMAEKDGTIAPDYDIEDIGTKVEEKKNKVIKYTKEKIKEDVEKTTSLSIIDDKNAIKGTKDNDEDLYNQLEKTATFKAIKDEYYFPEKKVRKKTKSKTNTKAKTKTKTTKVKSNTKKK